MEKKHKTYYAAIAADEAWSAELRRLFGKRAGDVRYTYEGAGATGSVLRALHDAKMDADRALLSASSTRRPVVACECSENYLRVDLLIDGVVYRGANVHGAGGLYSKKDSPRLLARLEKPEEVIRVYTKFKAEGDESFYVRAKQVSVVGVP